MGRDDLNRGDTGRIVTAHGTCLECLTADLRIQEHCRLWAASHDAWQTNPLRTQLRLMGMPDEAIAVGVARADIEAVAALLRTMGVPWRWCAEALVHHYFPVMQWNAEHPDAQKIMQVSAGITGLPAGRAPRHRGQDVAEWVRWWYRRTIKQPKDDLHVLVEEYARRENRVTEAHSVVINGIKRAEILLNRVIDRS